MTVILLALLGCNDIGLNDTTRAPVVELVLPVAGGRFDPLEPVEVCARVESVTPVDALEVVLSSDAGGTLASDGFTACDGGDVGIEVMLEGVAQTLSLAVTDGAGRTGRATVSVIPIDNEGPSCTILSPDDGSQHPADAPVDFVVEVVDPDGGRLDVVLQSTLDATNSATGFREGSGTVSLTVDLVPGDHDLVATVTDPRGGTGVCVASVEVLACQDVDGDGFDPCQGDCDDDDADVFPGAPEGADGQDNDCDGAIDEGTVLFDDDGDGLSELDGDCDDTDADVFPGAAEIPDDGIDQDCTGTDAVTCFVDGDGDGFGTSTTVIRPDGDCTATGAAPVDGDCDDALDTVFPGAAEVPNDGVDQDCDGADAAGCFQDLDGDGFGSTTVLPPGDADCDDAGESAFGSDCDDTDDTIFPGADDLLDDDVDQDCFGGDRITCFADGDGDGHGGPTVAPEQGDCVDGTELSTDCDDGDALVSPDATDLPDDGDDQDCNGVDARTCFEDDDADGYGSVIEVVAVDGTCDTGDRESEDDLDCDDTTAVVFPGAPEIVGDGIDQDCNGVDSSDCFVDSDDDGWGTSATVASTDADCTDAGEAGMNGDCNDGNGNINPGAVDVPGDAIDQDCNGAAAITCFVDGDRDGFGGTATVVAGDGACETAESEASVGGDCADGNASRYPGRPEIADDGVDQDCSGSDTITCYRDTDSDGYGAVAVLAADGVCNAGQNESALDGDCADSNPARHPGATEIPGDGVDQDCSGDDTVICYVDGDSDGYGTGAAIPTEGVCGAQRAPVAGDCADNNANRHPGRAEIPGDGIDQDCSGADTVSCFLDVDRDGYGTTAVLAADGVCNANQDEAPVGGDCAPSDATRNPGATEIVGDGIDQNCSGADTVVCYLDADNDEYGTGPQLPTEGTCGNLRAAVAGDCADNNPNRHPNRVEVAGDGIDQDCNGTDTVTCFLDVDRDGYGTTAVLAADGVCNLNQDEAPVGGDCAPNDANRYPGRAEIIGDGIDQDCSGADTVNCYLDADNDEYGVGGLLPTEGTCGTNRALVNGDCADNNPNRHPGRAEVVGDGIDQDCNGTDTITCFQDLDQDTWGSSTQLLAGDGVCNPGTPLFEAVRSGDCNDNNAAVFPGGDDSNATDGVDADCDGVDGTDADGDGFSSAVDCDDTDPDINPGTLEIRNGEDENCDGMCDEGLILAGQLIITEIMSDPDESGDLQGEWFEFYNTTAQDIVLCEGWTFEDDGVDVWPFPGTITIGAGDFLVAGANGTLTSNGGTPVDIVYNRNQLILAQGDDELALVFDGVLIDHVGWSSAFVTAGRSQQLDPDQFNATANNNTIVNWCDSTGPWPGGDGDFGTPGAANVQCP